MGFTASNVESDPADCQPVADRETSTVLRIDAERNRRGQGTIVVREKIPHGLERRSEPRGQRVPDHPGPCVDCRFGFRPGHGRSWESRDLEPGQDVAQEELRAKGTRHPVCGDDQDKGVARVAHYLPDRSIHRDVDRADRVGGSRSNPGVVSRMALIVKMPALMTRTMRLREDLREEVPLLLTQQLARDPGLHLYATNEPVSELPVVCCAPPHAITGRTGRMPTKTTVDHLRKLGRVGPKAVHSVVPAPLHHLYAIDVRLELCQRHVQDRDALACLTEEVPEGRRLDQAILLGEMQVICTRPELRLVVEPVSSRCRAGVKRRPGGPDEESWEALRWSR